MGLRGYLFEKLGFAGGKLQDPKRDTLALYGHGVL
jgi:hypothetical protein